MKEQKVQPLNAQLTGKELGYMDKAIEYAKEIREFIRLIYSDQFNVLVEAEGK